MRFSARVFGIVLLLGIFLLNSLAPFAHAQIQEQNTYNTPVQTNLIGQLNIPILTQQVFLGLLSTATCLVGGIDFSTKDQRCLNYNPQTGTYSYSQQTDGGLLGMAAGGVALTFSAPIHTADYLQYLSQNFGLVKSAHAANNGVGFDQLSPVTDLWLAFRNLAYLIFVIIFVVIGFAVMMRAKIDPRTVMTIENQIPKLIIALFLITFSFAIAGFVIDIMWVGIYLVINIFASLDPLILGKQVGVITSTVKDNPFNWIDTLNGAVAGSNAPFGFIGIAMQAAGAVKDSSNVIFANIFANAGWLKAILYPITIPATIGCIFGNLAPWAWGNIGNCVDNVYSTIVSTVIGGVAFVIFAIALLVAIAKLWWHLIKAYTLFLIFTIFGPLVIMSGVIPGWTKTNFEYWIRHVLAYALVFPTAMGIFLLGKTIMDVYSSKPNAAVPPLIGVSGGALAFMGPLLGFAIMMMAPQALAMVQDALNAPDPKYLASIGAGIGVGSAAFGQGFGKIMNRSFRESDPLRGLDEGWARKLLMPRNSLRREIFYGKETNTGIKANP